MKMLIFKMARKVIPDKFFSYNTYAQYIPDKYRDDVDKVARQLSGITGIDMGVSAEERPDSDEIERRRENLIRNFNQDHEGQFPKGYTDEAHEQSLRDSQGKGNFSSHPVNSLAGPGHNINSNMAQRNFER